MGKIPPVRVEADECPVVVGRKIKSGAIIEPGTTHYPHVGEWVDVVCLTSMSQFLDYTKLALIGTRETDKLTMSELQELDRVMSNLCESVSRRVVDWNFTDVVSGEPLPKPLNNPEAIRQLTEDELIWIIQAIQGETPEQRKNA